MTSDFTLRVFGGERLWGGEETGLKETEGVSYAGLIGQRQMARELLASGFSLQLQEDPSGAWCVAVEALRAGAWSLLACGCDPEMIVSGRTDSSLHGDPCIRGCDHSPGA